MLNRVVLIIRGTYEGVYGKVSSVNFSKGLVRVQVSRQCADKVSSRIITVDISELKTID